MGVYYDLDRLEFELFHARKNDPNGVSSGNDLERQYKMNQLKEMAQDKVSDPTVSFILSEILDMMR